MFARHCTLRDKKIVDRDIAEVAMAECLQVPNVEVVADVAAVDDVAASHVRVCGRWLSRRRQEEDCNG